MSSSNEINFQHVFSTTPYYPPRKAITDGTFRPRALLHPLIPPTATATGAHACAPSSHGVLSTRHNDTTRPRHTRAWHDVGSQVRRASTPVRQADFSLQRVVSARSTVIRKRPLRVDTCRPNVFISLRTNARVGVWRYFNISMPWTSAARWFHNYRVGYGPDRDVIGLLSVWARGDVITFGPRAR